MNILGRKGLSYIFKIILQCILIGGIIILITLPLCLKWYLEFSEIYTAEYFYKTLVLFYISGILALTILYQSIKLLKNINKKTPFIPENPRIIHTIGLCSLLIAFLYLIAIFVIKSIFVIILFMIFVILGFMSIILSEIFRKAIEYKEENDLTI